MTVGSAMIYTLNVNSPASHYIGYQVIAGIGMGLVIQVPVIVAQSISTRPDMSVSVAITLCKHQKRLRCHEAQLLTEAQSTSSLEVQSASLQRRVS